MSKFLNKVIRKVNRTISQVFTYDFKLDKLSEEDMNFKFPEEAECMKKKKEI